MSKVTIKIPIDYLMGHLRYGHYEATIDKEIFDKFNNLREKVCEETATEEECAEFDTIFDEILDYSHVEVDGWSIDDMGPALFSEMTWYE